MESIIVRRYRDAVSGICFDLADAEHDTDAILGVVRSLAQHDWDGDHRLGQPVPSEFVLPVSLVARDDFEPCIVSVTFGQIDAAVTVPVVVGMDDGIAERWRIIRIDDAHDNDPGGNDTRCRVVGVYDFLETAVAELADDLPRWLDSPRFVSATIVGPDGNEAMVEGRKPVGGGRG